MGDYASKSPFQSVARLTADATASGPAFALARSDRELWVASGHAGRFRARCRTRQDRRPRRRWRNRAPHWRPFRSPGRLVVMTFQDQETSGVALWGIDAETGAVAWKTIVGAPWPTPARGRRRIERSDDDRSRRPRHHDVRPSRSLAEGSSCRRCRGRATSRVAGWIVPRTSRSAASRVTAIVPERAVERALGRRLHKSQEPGSKVGLPAVPAADPIAWGSGILIPGLDSRAYLIDPADGPLACRAVRTQVRSRPPGDLAGTCPARSATRSCWPMTSAGWCGSRSRRPRSPRLVGEAERMLDQRIIAEPGVDRQRRHRGDRGPACPVAGGSRSEPRRIMAARLLPWPVRRSVSARPALSWIERGA